MAETKLSTTKPCACATVVLYVLMFADQESALVQWQYVGCRRLGPVIELCTCVESMFHSFFHRLKESPIGSWCKNNLNTIIPFHFISFHFPMTSHFIISYQCLMTSHFSYVCPSPCWWSWTKCQTTAHRLTSTPSGAWCGDYRAFENIPETCRTCSVGSSAIWGQCGDCIFMLMGQCKKGVTPVR